MSSRAALLVAPILMASQRPAAPHGPLARDPGPGPSAPQPAFVYQRLKGVSDAEIFQFMGPGKQEKDPDLATENSSNLPEVFWRDEAKAVALSLLNANRSETHLAAFDVQIEEREPAQPPAETKLLLTYSSAPLHPLSLALLRPRLSRTILSRLRPFLEHVGFRIQSGPRSTGFRSPVCRALVF